MSQPLPSPTGDSQRHAAKTDEVSWANLPTVQSDEMLAKELECIGKRRQEIRRRKAAETLQSGAAAEPCKANETVEHLQASLIGLALSGGGIRSGAFSLGVLSALKKARVLDVIDYLSTVSGGGYAGAYWSSWALGGDQPQEREAVGIDDKGRASQRLLKFIHSGNYLAQTANFFNRFIPGLVLIVALVGSGLIAGASGLAYLFRQIDQPGTFDAVAALGFDGDILRAAFPSVCLFLIWSLAWLLSYWKFGTQNRATVSGILFWPLFISVLAFAGLVMATGDIGLTAVETLLGKSPNARTIPSVFWYLMCSVVGASLLPYLRLPMLIRSGVNPQSPIEKYVFRIASFALLIGVPFVAFTWMAQENISKYLEARGPEVAEADLFAGLTPEQRDVVFDVMRKMGQLDERDEIGGSDLRSKLGELLKPAPSADQINKLMALNARYVHRPQMEAK